MDAFGNALVVGFTASPNYPITPGAFQSSIGAGWCGFVTKLSLSRITTRLYVIDRAAAVGKLTYLRGYLYHAGYTPVVGRTLDYAIAGTPVGSATTDANGRGTLSYIIPDTLNAGVYPLSVAFVGDATFNPAAGAATLTVSKGTLSIWVLSRTVARGATAYLRAYVRRLPDLAWVAGRTVAFDIDGTPMGAAPTDTAGRASVLSICPGDHPLGSHTIGATFAGDGSYLPATGLGALTVTP
jgi:hypothetical protein